jgi:hypothetical protein
MPLRLAERDSYPASSAEKPPNWSAKRRLFRKCSNEAAIAEKLLN